MLFMNEYEIDEAAQRHKFHPVLGPATKELARFKDLVNRSSDGWPYWKAAPRAAKKLMELIRRPNAAFEATEAEVRKALIPIKTFCTKRKLF